MSTHISGFMRPSALYAFGILWPLNWAVLLTTLLFFIATPAVFVMFFCRYSKAPFQRSFFALYLLLFVPLSLISLSLHLSSLPALLLEVLLLTLCGHHFCHGQMRSSDLFPIQKNKQIAWLRSLTIAILILTVHCVCHGILQVFFFWFIVKIPPSWMLLFTVADPLQELLQTLLLLFLLTLIHKHFSSVLEEGNPLVPSILIIPLFYISLVERTIRNSLYGDTIIFDSEQGICFPVVNHAEILILQLFAFLCLFLTLAACQMAQKALRHQQALQILEQQRQAQETYLQETQLRYEQTRSFRHDIRNHLAVLSGLLEQEHTEHARRYLADLRQLSSSLAAPVNTGNAAADALLGSKLALAAQAEIPVFCDLTLPKEAPVSDIDWCILLANAVDNAIHANQQLPSQLRHIHLSGTRKGNFFLLTVENPCQESLVRPSPGIGLSNIKAVMEKYQGKTELSVKDGQFHLQLLFCF